MLARHPCAMGADPVDMTNDYGMGDTLTTAPLNPNSKKAASDPATVVSKSLKSTSRTILRLSSISLNIIFAIALLSIRLDRVCLRKGSISHGFNTLQKVGSSETEFCSGNGIYVSTKGDGSFECVCDSKCFSGDDCSKVDNDCVLDLNPGDPTMFEKYWLNNKDSSKTIIEGWQHLSYHGREELGVLFVLPEFDLAIRSVHDLVGNAVTEGRHIIVGTGSTQLFLAAMMALSTLGKSIPASAVAVAPYYSEIIVACSQLYEGVTDYVKSSKFEWVGDPTIFNQNDDGSPYIEIVTSPNNPSGEIRYPTLNGAGAVVFDYAYYWPHFTAITDAKDEDVMLFTLSKCTGHAGTRIGWAIVKDATVATQMLRFISVNSVGVSKDSQMRAAQLLRSAVAGYSAYPAPSYVPKPTSSGDVEDFIAGQALFHFGASEMAYRWSRLRSTVERSLLFTLPEYPSLLCTFLGELRTNTPAFAWFHCKLEVNCEELMKNYGILGRGGPNFETDNRYHRLSMISPRSTFEMFIARLEVMERAALDGVEEVSRLSLGLSTRAHSIAQIYREDWHGVAK